MKEISWIKKAYFIKFFQVLLAAFCILGSEYDLGIEKGTMKVILVLEEMIKTFPDSIISISYGALITRVSEDEVGGT